VSPARISRPIRSRLGSWAQAVGYDVRAGRGLSVLESDRFVVSYPRSGNTWFRFLVANVLRPHDEVSFANIERIVPDIYANSHRDLRRLPQPRVLKSHESFDRRYSRVVYLVRDPRRIAPSYYRFLRMTRRLPEESIEAFIERFLAGELDAYGTWDSHVRGWLDARGDEHFAVVRYEDLERDTHAELRRCLTILEIPAEDGVLRSAVECAQRDQMQQLEQRDGHLWKPLQGADTSVSFVGSGGDDLGPAWERASDAIAGVWGDRMRELGYEA